ncbi:hypothetical protein ['Paenibacillus yunnanensis' Narsing Rao et al. 2020]|uniref:hypothetical protein n=1 Tax=Paenibacillus tengchongensis TaxID=2608684 RepID=UPI0016520056|nr:hypothetical protein [Paenibacillus tengchongensis]
MKKLEEMTTIIGFGLLIIGFFYAFFPRHVFYLGTFGLKIEKKKVEIKGEEISKGLELFYRVLGTIFIVSGVVMVVGQLFGSLI